MPWFSSPVAALVKDRVVEEDDALGPNETPCTIDTLVVGWLPRRRGGEEETRGQSSVKLVKERRSDSGALLSIKLKLKLKLKFNPSLTPEHRVDCYRHREARDARPQTEKDGAEEAELTPQKQRYASRSQEDEDVATKDDGCHHHEEHEAGVGAPEPVCVRQRDKAKRKGVGQGARGVEREVKLARRENGK